MITVYSIWVGQARSTTEFIFPRAALHRLLIRVHHMCHVSRNTPAPCPSVGITLKWVQATVSQDSPGDWTPVVHSSSWLDKTLFIGFFHLPIFPAPSSPISTSWYHLPNHLLALKSLFQSFFLENPNQTRSKTLVSIDCPHVLPPQSHLALVYLLPCKKMYSYP